MMRKIFSFAVATAVMIGTATTASLLNQESSERHTPHHAPHVSFKPAKDIPKPRKKIRRKQKKKLKDIKQAPIVSPNSFFSDIANLEMPTVNTDDVTSLFESEEAQVIPPSPSPSNSSPVYPLHARKEGLQGRVVISALVDEYGYVIKSQVKSSKPKGVFDSTSLAAVRGWKFSPARRNGETIEYWVEIPFNFVL
jgi:TonB family protein